MAYTSRELREVFHLLFLRRLLSLAEPWQFALKGGVNLRLFYMSPRLSEDMDIDVLAGSVGTLRKNGYRVLQDPAFARSLASFGIEAIRVGDPVRAKHTTTTQRFRARLVTASGEELPTKVEFSRRAIGADRLAPGSAAREADGLLLETATISPRIAGRYRQLAFPCQHYTGLAAVRQKVQALALRAAPQVRDAFDLHVLWLGGHWPAVDGGLGVPAADRERALENLLAMTYADYQGQVLDFIDGDARDEYAAESQWQRIAETVYRLLEGGEPSGR